MSDEEQNPMIEEINMNLPMSYPYRKKEIYVRECFEKYYEYIHNLWNDKDHPKQYITITGTPGKYLTNLYRNWKIYFLFAFF